MRDRAPHRRGRGGGAARGRPALPRRAAGPRPVPSVGPLGGGRRSSSRARTEAAALAVDRRITNSEGATVSALRRRTSSSPTRAASSAASRARRRASAAGVVAEDADGAMQRDYWYTTHRDHARLERPRERRAHRGRAHRAPAGRAPPPDLRGAGAVRGGRGRQPDRALRVGGERLEPVSALVVPARPARQPGVRSAGCASARSRTCAGEMASGYFDAEGVATAPRTVVEEGILRGWFLSTYSARKLGLAHHRQRGREPQPDRRAGRARFRRAAAAHGARASS